MSLHNVSPHCLSTLSLHTVSPHCLSTGTALAEKWFAEQKCSYCLHMECGCVGWQSKPTYGIRTTLSIRLFSSSTEIHGQMLAVNYSRQSPQSISMHRCSCSLAMPGRLFIVRWPWTSSTHGVMLCCAVSAGLLDVVTSHLLYISASHPVYPGSVGQTLSVTWLLDHSLVAFLSQLG